VSNTSAKNQRYLIIWRWHFYAGVLVTPFLILLAATGLAMLLSANIQGKEKERLAVAVGQSVQPLSRQAQAALEAADKERGSVVQYIAPRADDQVAVFRVNDGEGGATMVAVDPYTAAVVDSHPLNQNFYQLMDDIHGDLLIGTAGDFMMEAAASLTILLILTGLYLWWNKQRGIGKMLLPTLGKKRSFWRGLHGAIGSWVAVLLLFFCLSGLAWAGIWGGKMVQAWSQFPAGKWGVEPVPVSTLLHGDLNDGGSKEIPWVLELTPLPQSGSTAGKDGISPQEPLTLETLDRYAREIGFQGRYQLYFPKGDSGVWTLNQDSMSYDSSSPTADRTVHIDRYSGKILADIRYQDYSWFGKFMAVGVALHMGTLGWWSVAVNVAFCLAVITLCISGWIMWLQRRPAGAGGLVPPAQNIPLPGWKGAALLLLAIALCFPAAAMVIIVLWLLDGAVFSRIPLLRQWFH